MLRYIPEHINQFCIAALDVQFIHLLHEGVVQVIDSRLERTDQEALNAFSVSMAEQIVKRLECQMTQALLQDCRFFMEVFGTIAHHSNRFRDTIRRVHTIHLWLNMLRAGAQYDTPLLVKEVLVCICSVIKEINGAFCTEYVYWKKFIPELLEEYSKAHRHQHKRHLEIACLSIFLKLLQDDYTFLAHAHSQLGRKDFQTLIQMTIIITQEKEVQASNYTFCHQLWRELKDQQNPPGTTPQENRRIQQLANSLDTVWKSRIYRADEKMSTSGSSADASDEAVEEEEEELEQYQQQQPLLQQHGIRFPPNIQWVQQQQDAQIQAYVNEKMREEAQRKAAAASGKITTIASVHVQSPMVMPVVPNRCGMEAESSGDDMDEDDCNNELIRPLYGPMPLRMNNNNTTNAVLAANGGAAATVHAGRKRQAGDINHGSSEEGGGTEEEESHPKVAIKDEDDHIANGH